jgi:hypothetical protein
MWIGSFALVALALVTVIYVARSRWYAIDAVRHRGLMDARALDDARYFATYYRARTLLLADLLNERGISAGMMEIDEPAWLTGERPKP